jgi:2-haloacid dehalogenase
MGLEVDADAFASAWRERYRPSIERVHRGEFGWALLDDLHRMMLEETLVEFGLEDLPEARLRELNAVWHRLEPWPDAVEGLSRLRAGYMVCTLSNGNIGMLANMAKHAGLPWDCILSAENFGAYKPDPVTYLGVARTFAVAPATVMMVAAHHDDLAGARESGLATAYIERPDEWGPGAPKDVSARPENTLHCRNITALAERLGC